MENRKRSARKASKRIIKHMRRQERDGASWELPNIANLIDYGEITVGVDRGIGCIATACDQDSSLAMLARRQGESLGELLIRLDQAIGQAFDKEISTDEIN